MEPLFTTRNLPNGIALGLYIVQKNIEESKMTIDIDSIPFSGTEILIYIPLA